MASASSPVATGTLNFLLTVPTHVGGRGARWSTVEKVVVNFNPTKTDLYPDRDVTITRHKPQCTVRWPINEDVSVPWGVWTQPLKKDQSGLPSTGEMKIKGPTPKSPVKTYVFTVVPDGKTFFEVAAEKKAHGLFNTFV